MVCFSAMTCDVCCKVINSPVFIQCSKCNKTFDLLCANISDGKFNRASRNFKRSWMCCSCGNKQANRPKPYARSLHCDNDDTPSNKRQKTEETKQPSCSAGLIGGDNSGLWNNKKRETEETSSSSYLDEYEDCVVKVTGGSKPSDPIPVKFLIKAESALSVDEIIKAAVDALFAQEIHQIKTELKRLYKQKEFLERELKFK